MIYLFFKPKKNAMKKKLRFALISIWILLTRSYDAYATYQYTPDLNLEANPLVSVLGMGWLPLLSIIGCLTLATIYAYHQSLFHPIDLFPEEKNYTFSEFIGYFYMGRKTSFWALFYRLPPSLKRFTHYCGRLLTPALVFAGLVSTVMWLLIDYTDFYLKEYHSAELIYTILVVGSTAITYRYFRQQYALYLAKY